MEILSPAGNMAGVIAAINGGANAIYLGGKQFSARQKADNFDHIGLQKVVELCHAHNVKVYITQNILIKDKELQDALDEAKFYWETGADALIVQDPGLIFMLRTFYPQIRLQTSTQASVFGLSGVRFFEDLGFDRVVLPREMSLQEVERIKKESHVELKVFGHGALCYAYSGQCLFSSLIGGRSGNRGCCAQPCRKKYRLKTIDGKVLKSGYLMSMMDLNTRHSVKKIAAAGVDSIKIEGRMKGTPYIYATANAYRKTLEGEPSECDDGVLKQIFNRDFTSGWLLDDDQHINAVTGRNKGIEIGKVSQCKSGKVILKLKSGIHLNQGDGLSFGRDAKKGMIITSFSQKGQQALIETSEKVPAGIPVYRTMDAALQKKLENKAGKPVMTEKIPICVHLKIQREKPVWIKVTWNKGQLAYQSELMAVPAENAPITREIAEKQLQKLGDSSYILQHFEAEIDTDLFLSKGELNAIRRDIVIRLDEKRKTENLRRLNRVVINEVLPVCKRAIVKHPVLSLVIPEQICISGNIAPWLDNAADELVLPLLSDLKRTAELLKTAHLSGKETVLSLPRIMNTMDEAAFKKNMDKLCALPVKIWRCPHYEALQLLRYSGLKLEAGSGLHLFNRASATALKKWGCHSAELSPELTGRAAEEIAAFSELDCVLTVFGHQEMMVSKNCLHDCRKKHCDDCTDHSWYFLEDERGAAFPFYRDWQGMMRIFNADKLFIKKPSNTVKHIAKWRIYATLESPEMIKNVLSFYQKGTKTESLNFLTDYQGRYTNGNFKREVE